MRISDWSSDVCSSDLKRESLLKALPWLLLAAAFLLLSLDEAISLHEWLSAAIGARVNNTGIFYFVWAAPALVLCLAGLACFLPFILGFKGLDRALLIGSAIVFLSGAVGVEMLEIGRASCRERVCQYV